MADIAPSVAGLKGECVPVPYTSKTKAMIDFEMFISSGENTEHVFTESAENTKCVHGWAWRKVLGSSRDEGPKAGRAVCFSHSL